MILNRNKALITSMELVFFIPLHTKLDICPFFPSGTFASIFLAFLYMILADTAITEVEYLSATSWSPVWIPVTTWYFRFVLNCDQGFMWPFGTHYFLFFNFLNFLLSSSFVRRNASFSSRSSCWSFCCETDCDESKHKFIWLPPKDSPLLFCCFWGVASHMC